MSDVEIVRGYVPGAIGRVAELHGTYYHTEGPSGVSRLTNSDSNYTSPSIPNRGKVWHGASRGVWGAGTKGFLWISAPCCPCLYPRPSRDIHSGLRLSCTLDIQHMGYSILG
jgi:hypothetical protein